jgi:hypothetical protein
MTLLRVQNHPRPLIAAGLIARPRPYGINLRTLGEMAFMQDCSRLEGHPYRCGVDLRHRQPGGAGPAADANEDLSTFEGGSLRGPLVGHAPSPLAAPPPDHSW